MYAFSFFLFFSADLLQLLLVCLQSSVFNIESNPDLMINYGGGDNKDIVEDVEANKPIPCEDFTIEQKYDKSIARHDFENYCSGC